MSRISRNLSIIVRSERLIARRRMAVRGRQMGIIGAAAILGGIGLIMVNASGYLALAERMDPALAALIVAGVNLVLAAVLISLASSMNAEGDIREVSEVRDMAVADLEDEVELATEEVRELAGHVHKMARDPFGAAGMNVLGSLLAMLLKNLRK